MLSVIWEGGQRVLVRIIKSYLYTKKPTTCRNFVINNGAVLCHFTRNSKCCMCRTRIFGSSGRLATGAEEIGFWWEGGSVQLRSLRGQVPFWIVSLR